MCVWTFGQNYCYNNHYSCYMCNLSFICYVMVHFLFSSMFPFKAKSWYYWKSDLIACAQWLLSREAGDNTGVSGEDTHTYFPCGDHNWERRRQNFKSFILRGDNPVCGYCLCCEQMLFSARLRHTLFISVGPHALMQISVVEYMIMNGELYL